MLLSYLSTTHEQTHVHILATFFDFRIHLVVIPTFAFDVNCPKYGCHKTMSGYEFMTWFERTKVKWKFLHNWKSGAIKIDTRVLYIYINWLLLKNKNIDTTPHLFHKLKFIYTRPTLVWTPHVVAPPFVIWSHLVSIMFLDFPMIISHAPNDANIAWKWFGTSQLVQAAWPGKLLCTNVGETYNWLAAFQVKLFVSSMQTQRLWHVLCTTI